MRTRPLSPICCLGLVALAGAVVWAGGDSRRSLEHGQFTSEGAFRGFTLPGVAVQQHERALADWKKLYARETPAHFETERFLLYGTIDAKKLKEVGALLEKTFDLAAKTLESEMDKLWSGKLTIFLVAERGEFTSLVRILEKRRAEEEELGSYDIDDEATPHVIAGPSLRGGLLPEQQAGVQIAAALAMRKGGRALPHWVQEAFGRATVLRAGPAKAASAEHRKVALAVTKGKRSLKDVLGKSLPDLEETALLQASFMEYLAYSGRTSKFMPFIRGFQPGETMPEPKVEAALDAANLPVDKLDAVWKTWLKTLK